MRLLPICAVVLASSAHALSGENHSPPHAAAPPEPPSWTTMPRKLFDAFVLGKTPPVDYVAREADDKRYGVTRLTDTTIEDYKGTPAGREGIWIIMVNAPKGDQVSDHLVEAHNNATIQAKQEGLGQLSDVHWARLDFQEEWQTCARWVLLRPPSIVVATQNFRNLRFISPGMLPNTPESTSGEKLYQVVQRKAYENLKPWSGSLAPGGEWEYVKELYIVLWTHWNRYFGNVPRIFWLLASGALTQFLMKFMHSDLKPGAPAAAAARKPATQKTSQPFGQMTKERQEAVRAALAEAKTKKKE